MASLLLRAFTFEAYLNHLGERHLKLWKQEKRMGWRRKFRKVYAHLGFNPKMEKRHYATLRPLFKFRNLMAHESDGARTV
jgi:hypothetical protein